MTHDGPDGPVTVFYGYANEDVQDRLSFWCALSETPGGPDGLFDIRVLPTYEYPLNVGTLGLDGAKKAYDDSSDAALRKAIEQGILKPVSDPVGVAWWHAVYVQFSQEAKAPFAFAALFADASTEVPPAAIAYAGSMLLNGAFAVEYRKFHAGTYVPETIEVEADED